MDIRLILFWDPKKCFQVRESDLIILVLHLVDAVMPWQKIDKLMKFDCEVINYIDAQ